MISDSLPSKNLISNQIPSIDTPKVKSPKIGLSILPSIKKPSINLPKFRFKADSSVIAEKIKADTSKKINLPFSGESSWEYLNGFVPFAVDTNTTLEMYRAYGHMNVQLAKLPWQFQYNYSPQSHMLGMNNYFRLNFDVRKFQDQIGMKKFELKDSLNTSFLDLEKQQEQLIGQKLYLESLLDIQNLKDFNEIGEFDLETPEVNVPKTPNLPDMPTLPTLPDSLTEQDELNKLESEKQKVRAKIDQVNSTLEEVNKKKQLIEDKLEYINNGIPTQNLMQSGELEELMSKKETILSHVKKFQIGMSTPEISPLLMSGTSINGINLEYSGKRYLAVAHGITANQLFVSSNPLQNSLNSARNVYNFFDFNGVNNGKRITAIKTGFGDNEKTHIHLGILQGYGNAALSGDLSSQSPSREENYVLELESRFDYLKNNYIQFNYAKSFLQSDLTDTTSLVEGFQSIFSDERSHALFATNHAEFKKLRSTLDATFRWIDPHYQSFGMGFLREDNIRYELKSKHRLTKKIRLDLKFRKERDNLLNLYDYKNTLTTFGGQLRWKLLKSVSLTTGYHPVIHEFKNASFHAINKNYISNAVLTISQNSRRMFQLYTFSFNEYKISSDSVNLNFQNFNFTHELRINDKVALMNMVNYLKSNQNDQEDIVMSSHGLTIVPFTKVTVNGQLKTSYTTEYKELSLGYKAGLAYNLSKYFRIEMNYEEFLDGEYFRNFDEFETNAGLSPYLISFKIVNTF
ncbi:MAG: hypothetical protein MRY83_07690 [Flavobacteriales bacterium]|nr:hypothetical protein [Flavobacteriales bacterium]